MSRRKESIPYMLVHDCPWWVSVILSGVVCGLMSGVAPQLGRGDSVLGPLTQALPGVAWMGGGFFLVMGALSFWRQVCEGWVNRRREEHSPASTMSRETHASAAPACPDCGGEMIQRKARRGPNPESRFWGCARYPACEGTRSL